MQKGVKVSCCQHPAIIQEFSRADKIAFIDSFVALVQSKDQHSFFRVLQNLRRRGALLMKAQFT